MPGEKESEVVLIRIGYIIPLAILLVLLFSGCYSAMHTANVVDGHNLTFSVYPIHHDIEFSDAKEG